MGPRGWFDHQRRDGLITAAEAEGSMEKLVGRIQERSGERREAIEKWFKSLRID